MVAPAGIYPISGFNGFQCVTHSFRIADGIVIIIKNISCNTDNIRILGIDLFYHFLCMSAVNAVTEMGICKKDDLKGIHVLHLFVDGHFIRRYFDGTYMQNTVNADENNQCHTDKACDHEGAAKFQKSGMKYILKDQAYKVDYYNYQNNVEKCAEKIVASVFQDAVKKFRLVDQETCKQ